MFYLKIMFDTLTIIGPGLLGASIGMASRKHSLAKKIQVWIRNEEKYTQCINEKWCDNAHTSIINSVEDSDLIILCTPVDTIIPLLKEILPHLKRNAVVTDIGSVKGSICKQADLLVHSSHQLFIGSHPMAGSEKTGMKYASETLLEGSPCILCPTKQSDPNALKKVKKFWESLKMKTVSMNPSLHDSTVAQISHLPHVVASLLSASLSGTPKDSFAFAGGGLKDTTRVAGGSPILWQTIIEQNSKEILQSLEKFEEVVKVFKHNLETNDYSAISEILIKGQNVRKNIENAESKILD